MLIKKFIIIYISCKNLLFLGSLGGENFVTNSLGLF